MTLSHLEDFFVGLQAGIKYDVPQNVIQLLLRLDCKVIKTVFLQVRTLQVTISIIDRVAPLGGKKFSPP